MPGVYISYPFCRQKCTYCNFASDVLPADLEREYIDALLREIRAFRWDWTPETLYLGGGSPDRIGLIDFRRVLGAIPPGHWKEATIEAAPGDITGEKADCWAGCGVNRVSLGAQSFVEQEIRRTGRKHTAEIVAADVTLLRKAGLGKINIDLIAGLSGQTRESWAESLDWIERLEPGHVSVYMLEVDEDSRLGREVLAGGGRYGAEDVPDNQLVVELYVLAIERLARMGILRYEISNFARPGEESLHNLKYWRFEPYVGFGADAHSFDLLSRTRNVEMAAEYVDRSRRQRSLLEEEIIVEQGEERFFVGLRLSEGIVPTPEEWKRFRKPIAKHIKGGLLERAGDRLRLTGQGVLLSNEVFQEFI